MKFDWNTSTAKTNFIHHAMRKNNLEQPSKITFRMYVNMFDFVKKKMFSHLVIQKPIHTDKK